MSLRLAARMASLLACSAAWMAVSARSRSLPQTALSTCEASDAVWAISVGVWCGGIVCRWRKVGEGGKRGEERCRSGMGGV